MYTLGELERAYEEFWEYVKDYVDKEGWLPIETSSAYIRNCFQLSHNVEKTETHWRPRTLKK